MPAGKFALINLLFLGIGYFLGKKVQRSNDAVLIADIGMDAAKAIMDVKEHYKEA